jgi:GntR family transcriptional regulator
MFEHLSSMKIDHDSPLPLHAQVEALVRDLVRKPRYRSGELLPPEARIAENLGVSRNTVRAAISRLVQEGVLERKAGLGTRYVNQAVKTSLRNWPSFTGEMKQRGLEVEVFSLDLARVRPPSEVARALRISTGKILRMARIRGHGGIPSVVSVSWFHECAKLDPDDDFSRPLYELIRAKSGITVEYSEEEISAALADQELAEKLCCKVGDPILVRRRIVRNAAKREIEYNVNHYRADRFTYGLTIRKQSP